VTTTGMAVILAGFAQPLLTCWIGADMGANTTAILRMLAIGIALSCYFDVPATALLAGSGRPEITAVQFAWAAATHLAVSMMTVRWLGATGVALGFAAGYLVALCGSNFWLVRNALSHSALRQLYGSLLPCWAVAAAVGVPFSYALAPLPAHTVQVMIAMAAAYAVYITLATRLSYNATERFKMRQRAVSLIPLRLVGGRA
jgi:O-antigen/teichoic acid export membrane protein